MKTIPKEQLFFILICGALLAGMGILSYMGGNKSLNIKSKTVGNGQHGTARWATKGEIQKTYAHVPFESKKWRACGEIPSSSPQRRMGAAARCQGIVAGCVGSKRNLHALVDTGDVHALMIGAAGVGKTAYFMIPNIEYALASGMSILVSDTKGDLYKQYSTIAREQYGFEVSILDLRNPALSDGFNMLHLVNRYMDEYLASGDLAAQAKAERYAKITAKTIISSGQDSGSMGQNAFFYEAAEGLLTAVILLIAEFCPAEQRHIISCFKLIQDLLAPAPAIGGKPQKKSRFQLLMEKLPSEHKARWFAGAALNSSEQAMMSVLSTAMSRLNAFLDSELEQMLCSETTVDAEKFAHSKSALFVVLPEENPTTFFLMSLIIQQLYRELLSVADECGGKLPRRVLFLLDEFGSIPKIDSAEVMFSAGRSRRISIIAIIQSLAQLEKNYGKEGAEIIWDNTQLTIFGGFAPNSETANKLSKNLGEQTIMSGSISKGKGDGSQTLQMMGRPLITPDELKALSKGQFIVAKTGSYPMQTTLRLFTDWGITLTEDFSLPKKPPRKVQYADINAVESAIQQRFAPQHPQSFITDEWDDFTDDLPPHTRKVKTVFPKKGGRPIVPEPRDL